MNIAYLLGQITSLVLIVGGLWWLNNRLSRGKKPPINPFKRL
jgi:hypothetical protein